MRRSLPPVARLEIALDTERRVTVGDLKNGILTLLGAWLGYFLVINFFVQTLDRINVPYLDMPLGQCLAAQGMAVMFFCALVLLIRRHRHG